jgi:hypothetical protein
MDTKITVNVSVLPFNIHRQARIEPLSSFERIKVDLINGLNKILTQKGDPPLGHPDEFSILIAPSTPNQKPQTFTIKQGDLIYLIHESSTPGSAAEII